jgi:hypothetical protein
MKWSYKTVHFELKKEGLLGGAFLDEAEIEEQLNDYGRSGWELISVLEVQDGIIAFFKQSLDSSNLTALHAAQEVEETELADASDYILEPVSPLDPYMTEMQNSGQSESAGDGGSDQHEDVSEDSYLTDDSASTAVQQGYSKEPKMQELDERDPDQEHEKQDEEPLHNGIGAIKIE